MAHTWAPERITFPSRKTSFPLFARELGDAWLQLLNLTLRCGSVKTSSEGDRLAEVLNAVVSVELADREEALPPFLELTRADAEYSYAERLKESYDTLVLLGPSVSASFDVADERLYGSYVLRSEDVHNAWPSDALSLVRLQREVAERSGIPVASATFIMHSAYLYERDWDRASKTLDQWFERPLPLQTDPSGLFLFGLDEGRARAMLITHEADAVLWEGEFDSPEELSWYIVDVMPWLSAQHIRYIGQECASMTRALQEGEEYVQG
jgi:hypothetical protein